MSYNPESTVPSSLPSVPPPLPMVPGPVNAAAGLPIPDRLAPYYTHPMFPGAPPPAHGSARDEHPHLGVPPGGRPPPIDGPDPAPSSHLSSNSATDTDSPDVAASAHLHALLSSQPATLPAARVRYTLKTSRPPPKSFDPFFAYAKGRGCLVVWRDFAPFWRVEIGVAAQLASAPNTHGIAALAIHDGRAHKPEHQATYFDGDWEGTVNKVRFAFALCFVSHCVLFSFLGPAPCRPCTLLELAPTSLSRPCLSLGCSALFLWILSDSASTATPTLTSTSTSTISFSPRPPTPVCLSACPLFASFGPRPGPSTLPPTDFSPYDERFASALPPMTVLINGRDEPRVVFDVGPLFEDPPSSTTAQTLTDPTLFTLSPPRTGAFFARPERKDFYYRNSWWAGKFEYADNVKWEDKKEVLYDCDADAIRNAYNITGESVSREEAYIGTSTARTSMGIRSRGGTFFGGGFCPHAVPHHHQTSPHHPFIPPIMQCRHRCAESALPPRGSRGRDGLKVV
ncbi:hypothetical protein B0H13DRAFT_2328080 [Mycena leptocephala]|nr:hypothetical protein B0H13DRAFT_2328080 [Mycena leptocephala]